MRRSGAKPARENPAGSAYHWREYRIEEFLPSASVGNRVLLLGCGDGGESRFLKELGFKSVGLDIRASTGTDVLGDAHALPIRSGSLDVVLSMQVLEHLHSPWVAVEEIARVLRPGGWFVGSVAFLKPYHRSYFHMSHQGVRHLLQSAGLEVDKCAGAQSMTYSMYGANLPVVNVKVRRAVLGLVDRAILGLRAKAWSLTRRLDPDEPTDRFNEGLLLSFRALDRLRFAPAIVFRAQKVSK